MELREILNALRAAWWLLVVGLLVGGLAGLGLSLLGRPKYTSHTQLFVSTTQTATTSDVFQGSQFSEQRVASYARLLVGPRLASLVVRRLDLPLTPAQLSREIGATAISQTVLLDVTVTDPSPARAQRIAAAIGAEFPSLVDELEAPAAGGRSPVKVTVTEAAELPESPSEPRIRRNVALGTLVGLMAAITLAILRTRLDRSVRDPDLAQELASAPLIGTVLKDEMLASRHVIDRVGSHRVAEDYRRLRTNLQFLNVDDPPKVIMISSAMSSEGKTTLTINLGLALAEVGRRVTIVAADLRRPRLTQYLNMVGDVGLTNILAGSAGLDDVLQPYQSESLFVLAAGPTPPNPGELLASANMSALLDKLRGANDYVLIDAPPLLPVADSTGLATLADGVLLSVRYGRTMKEQLHEAAGTLERVQARLLGIVLNIVPLRADIAGGYGYSERYIVDPASTGKRRSHRKS